jgi:phosphatidylglycerol lysyltransferase
MDAVDRSRLEELAFRHGLQYDSYLATDTLGKEYFWGSAGSGVVCLIRMGRRVAVFGGLLAPEPAWDSLVEELRKLCKERGFRLGFFGVEARQRALLESKGFQVTKVGEDAIVDLPGCTWSGKKYEWLRRQSNFCQRAGLVVEECVRERLSADEWKRLMDELAEVNRQFLQDRPHNQGLRNVVSRFDPELLFRQRLFVARSTSRQCIEAFVVCTPASGGTSWALECYRQRNDATRGAVPFTMHQVLRQLQEAGQQAASLCMVPLLNCREPRPGDSALVRRAVSFSYEHASALYDSKGLYHFKSRFRPRFEDRWLCLDGRGDLGWLVFLLYALGLHRVHPILALKSVLRQFGKKADRETLADPEQRGDKPGS